MLKLGRLWGQPEKRLQLPLSATFPPEPLDKWNPGENIVPVSRGRACLLQPWNSNVDV